MIWLSNSSYTLAVNYIKEELSIVMLSSFSFLCIHWFSAAGNIVCFAYPATTPYATLAWFFHVMVFSLFSGISLEYVVIQYAY